jgi:large subunit ribosomal protein L9
MQVLLRDDVEGLGKRGDIVSVARGFARNFLMPTGRAIEATSAMSDQAAAMRRARDLRDAKDREAAEAVAGVVAGAAVTITARAGTEGRLFGSVTAADVADAVRERTGAVIDRRQIHLEEPIKSVGTHAVPVRLHADVATEVTVEVVPA